MFNPGFSCLTMSSLPWFMKLSFQVPMQYCSFQYWALLSPPDTSKPSIISSLAQPLHPSGTIGNLPLLFLRSILDTFQSVGLTLWYHIFLSSHTARGQGRNTGVGCLFFSSGPHIVRTLHYDLFVLGGLHRLAHNFTELCKPFSMTRLWCMFLLLLFSHSVCNPKDWRTPGFLVLHYLLEFTQTYVHRVDDASQPSHLLSSPSPPALNLSQPQSLFQWVDSLHQVAKVLKLQHQSFLWVFRVDFLWGWLVWSPCSPRDSQESSPTPQFKNTSSSASNQKEQASFNFMAAVTVHSNFGPQENEVCHCFHCFHIYLPWSDRTCAMILVFECWVLSQFFHSPFSFSSRGSLVPLHFPPLAWCYLNIWSYWYFSRQSWFHLMIHLAWHFT